MRSTEKEMKELMGLVGALAQDTALYMGDFVKINKVETSAKVLEDRLRAILSELEEARVDAARWQEVALGSSPFLSVFYVDNCGNERMLCGQDAVDVVDAVRKGES